MYIEKEEEKNTEHNGLRSYQFRSNNLQNHVQIIPMLFFVSYTCMASSSNL